MATNGGELLQGAGREGAAIIRFWRTVEMFNPAPVDKVRRERRVYSVNRNDPLPWEPEHELARVRLRKSQAWQHRVYLGIFSLESVFKALSRVFPADPDSFDERPRGESALAAFVVSGEGRPLIGSQVLSSCAWATGRIRDPGPRKPAWLDGFEEASKEFAASFAEVVAPDPTDTQAEVLRGQGHDVGRPADGLLLRACLDAAAEVVHVDGLLPQADVRIKSTIVAKRRAHTPDGHDFLNSFIADDLATVAKEARAGRIGTTLCQ